MFINFHAHPLHILWVINIFAIHCFFFPLVYMNQLRLYTLRHLSPIHQQLMALTTRLCKISKRRASIIEGCTINELTTLARREIFNPNVQMTDPSWNTSERENDNPKRQQYRVCLITCSRRLRTNFGWAVWVTTTVGWLVICTFFNVF